MSLERYVLSLSLFLFCFVFRVFCVRFDALFLCFGVCIGPVFHRAISCVFMLSVDFMRGSLDFMRGSLLIINGFIKKSDHRRSIATRH